MISKIIQILRIVSKVHFVLRAKGPLLVSGSFRLKVCQIVKFLISIFYFQELCMGRGRVDSQHFLGCGK